MDLLLTVALSTMFSLPVCGIIWFIFRKRISWNLYDYLLPIIPAVWLGLMYEIINLSGPERSLHNVVHESIVVSALVVAATIIRLKLHLIAASPTKENPQSLNKKMLFYLGIIIVLIVMLVPNCTWSY